MRSTALTNRRAVGLILRLAFLAIIIGMQAAPTAQGAALGSGVGDPMAYPASTMGVVLGSDQGARLECSGSVIDTPGPDTVVMTAGHCVRPEEFWHPTNHLVFLPAYDRGSTPFGPWSVKSVDVDPHWSPLHLDVDHSEDVAFLTLEDRHGFSLKRLTGAIGIAFDQSPDQSYTDWGYPQETPYDGESLVRITSGLLERSEEGAWATPTMGIRSDFTGGSSGGPWTIGPTDRPTAVSMNSYTEEGVHDEMWGPYFGPSIQKAFESAGGDPSDAEPVPPRPVRPRLVVHTHQEGGRTAATFGISPGYPLSVRYFCSLESGPTHSCMWPSFIPDGQRMRVEAWVGAPGHRHRLAQVVTSRAIS